MAALTFPTDDDFKEVVLGDQVEQQLNFTAAVNDGDTISATISRVEYALFVPNKTSAVSTSVSQSGTGGVDLTVRLSASSTGKLIVRGYR